MALELSLKLYSINADFSTFILQDETVYGGTNPQRNEVALYLDGVKKVLDGDDETIEITPNVTDPLTVSQWTVEYLRDGWFSMALYAVPVWDALTSYALNDCVFEDNVLYKALASNDNVQPSTNPAVWQVLTDNADLQNAANVTWSYFDFHLTSNSEVCYSKVTAQASMEMCANQCDTLMQQLYREVDLLLQGAFVKCQQQKSAEFEQIIRVLDTKCEEYGDIQC